jgi:hypothetical protein
MMFRAYGFSLGLLRLAIKVAALLFLSKYSTNASQDTKGVFDRYWGTRIYHLTWQQSVGALDPFACTHLDGSISFLNCLLLWGLQGQ